jgi:A/G-specific adenine glycosylase
MWELPHIEAPDKAGWDSLSVGKHWLEEALAEDGIQVRATRHIGDAQHTFTHLLWNIKVLAAVVADEEHVTEQTLYKWVGPDDFENYAWPNVFRKLLTEYFVTKQS